VSATYSFSGRRCPCLGRTTTPRHGTRPRPSYAYLHRHREFSAVVMQTHLFDRVSLTFCIEPVKRLLSLSALSIALLTYFTY